MAFCSLVSGLSFSVSKVRLILVRVVHLLLSSGSQYQIHVLGQTDVGKLQPIDRNTVGDSAGRRGYPVACTLSFVPPLCRRHRIARREADSHGAGGDADGLDASLSASGKGDSGKRRSNGSGRITSMRSVLTAASAFTKGTQASPSSVVQGASAGSSTSPGDGSQIDEAGSGHSSTAR